jgi:HAD superfamily phosphoserine phosphatase-like hydrolase
MSPTTTKRKLIIFDVEGVLLPKNRYLAFEAGRSLSFPQFIKLLSIGLLYEARLLRLESALRRIFNLFRGFTGKELVDIFAKVPLLPDTEAVFAKLREKGFKTALISSGLPQVVVENLASRLKTDYAVGLELETNDSVLTGNIDGDVIRKDGKASVMEKILKREGLTRKDCVVVADDRNNSQIFHPETLKIGYNPDFLIAFKSDHVIKESLLEIFSILEETQKRPRYSLTLSEAIREAIHGSGLFITLAAMRFGNYQVAFLLFLMALVYMASELARLERKSIPVISSITLKAATSSERYEFTTAPISFALGIMLSLLLFPTPVNYASIAIISLGDSAASVFGKLFGKTSIPFNKGKNLEGSFAGFAFAFLGASFFLSPLQAFIGAFVGMLVESLPLPVNDNLSTPLVTGALLTLIL